MGKYEEAHRQKIAKQREEILKAQQEHGSN